MESPKLTTQSSEDLIAWNELDLSSIDLGYPALNFDLPSFFRPGVNTVVK